MSLDGTLVLLSLVKIIILLLGNFLLSKVQNIALFYLYTFFVNYEDVFLSFGFPQK